MDILGSVRIIHTLDLHQAPVRVGGVLILSIPEVSGPAHNSPVSERPWWGVATGTGCDIACNCDIAGMDTTGLLRA